MSPPPLWHRPQLWFAAWGAWFLTLNVLSSMSHPGPKIDLVGFDKVVHTGFFALGGILLALALRLRRPSPMGPQGPQGPLSWPRIALLVLAAGAAIGWFDEWHQSFTPGRHGLDHYDWLADVLGSLLAPALARPLLHCLPGPRP